MLIVAQEWPGPQYPWWAALCALCPKRWQLPQDRPVYLRGGTGPMPAPRWRKWAFLLDSREGLQAQMPPTPLPPPTHQPLAPPVSETPRDQDPGAQLMVAHRHTDTLPPGSRPGKVERRRDVPRFHPTGPPGGAPTTRSAAKPRPSSLAPPDSARPTLFQPRETAQASTHAPAQASPHQEGPAPRVPPVAPIVTEREMKRVDAQGGTRKAPRDPQEAPMETDSEPVARDR